MWHAEVSKYLLYFFLLVCGNALGWVDPEGMSSPLPIGSNHATAAMRPELCMMVAEVCLQAGRHEVVSKHLRHEAMYHATVGLYTATNCTCKVDLALLLSASSFWMLEPDVSKPCCMVCPE